jgi:hypothetical protein
LRRGNLAFAVGFECNDLQGQHIRSYFAGLGTI